jgi:hypothetical protein
VDLPNAWRTHGRRIGLYGLRDHTTQAAGTIGGVGIADPLYRGMGPGVRLVSRAYNQNTSCSLSAGFLYTDPGNSQDACNVGELTRLSQTAHRGLVRLAPRNSHAATPDSCVDTVALLPCGVGSDRKRGALRPTPCGVGSDRKRGALRPTPCGVGSDRKGGTSWPTPCGVDSDKQANRLEDQTGRNTR